MAVLRKPRVPDSTEGLDYNNNSYPLPGGSAVFNDPPPAPEAPPVTGPPEPIPETPAFDVKQQVGHNGKTSGGLSREDYRNLWQSSGITNNAGLDAWLAKNGGVRLGDNGVVQTPFGEQIDMGQGFSSGSGSAAWGGVGGGSGSPGSFTTSASAATLGVPSGSAGGGSYPGGGGGFGGNALKDALAGLFKSGGGFNQDIVNKRVSNARDEFERARKSRIATDQALLADRGLLGQGQNYGSGPEGTAYTRAGEAVYGDYNAAVNDIYANEGQAADARMIQALQISAGMTAAEAENAVNWFRAQSERSLGEGQLALGNKTADQNYGLGMTRAGNDYNLGLGGLALGNMNGINSYNLGMANYGLNREKLSNDIQNSDVDQLIALLNTYMSGANTSAGGFK